MTKVVDQDYPGQDRLSDQDIKNLAIQQASPAVNESVKNYAFPTETIDLPSRGLLYQENSPLSSGTIEIKYMTAKEEDILTSQNLIKNGTVIDVLLRSLIVSPINYNELLVGDKNAIMIAARVLAYGKNYEVELTNPSTGAKQTENIDLTLFSNKNFDEDNFEKGQNKFSFQLPASKRMLEFKLLTHGDDKQIADSIKAAKKASNRISGVSPELSTRLKHMIVSVDGEMDRIKISKFVDTEFLSRDSIEFREYIKQVSPDIDLTYVYYGEDDGEEYSVTMPMSVKFFWPRS